MNQATKKVLLVIFDYILITFGALLFVMGWTSFLLPNGIIDGGLTGICALLSMVTGVPVEYWNIGINGLLLVIAWIVLGRNFGIKTIYTIVLTSVLFRVLGGDNLMILKAIPGQPLALGEKVLVPVIGGLLEAVGLGLVLLRGGSTGGTDILALIINKFWPVSLGTVFIFCDVFVIASILLVPGKTFQDMMYGYVAMVVFSVAIDFVTTGRKSKVQVLIFSNHYQEIADYIMNDLKRGVTALNAIGWYTKEDKRVLLVVVRKRELRNLTRAVKLVDPKAFMSVSQASGVYGEGFEEMKAGIQKKSKKKVQ